MMKALTVNRGANGEHTYAIPAPDYVNSYALGASVAETVTIPSGATVAMFSALSDFYVSYGTAATVPSGDVTDGSASELNPTVRDISGYSTLSIVSPTGSNQVTITFYA